MAERRNQGFLTLKDRTIFEESRPDQYPPHFRERAREKFKQALADLAFTSENFETEDIAQVFEVLTDPNLSGSTTYTHEPFSRDTIVDALALFFQATELISDQDESALDDLIQEAVRKAYHRSQPEQVVGSVDFELETAPRQEAYDRGCEKIRDGEWLTISERRAVFEAESSDQDGYVGGEKEGFPEYNVLLQDSDLTQYIIDHLDMIEPGLKQTEFQPGQAKDQFDIFCEDQAGQLVLIKLMMGPMADHHIMEIESRLVEYGGTERVRGIVIGVDRGALGNESTEAEFDFYELQLGPHGVIKGFEG